MTPGVPTERAVDEPLNSMKAIWTRPESEVEADDFNEFYMKNNPRFAGAPFSGVDSSVTNSLQQTGQNKFNMYNTAGDEAGRGSFNHEDFG